MFERPHDDETEETPRPAFALMLMALRERSGMSQSEFSKMVRMDHSYISRLESGGRVPSRETVRKISFILARTKEEERRFFTTAGFLPDDADFLVHENVQRLHDLMIRPDIPPVVRSVIEGQINAMIRAIEEALGKRGDGRAPLDLSNVS